MKKSNILIFLPVFLLLSGLIFYNFKLKKIYDTKEYKNRFHDMDYTAVKNINTLDLKSANYIGIQVEYGTKEGLWVAKSLKDNIEISMNGSTLSLDFVKKEQADDLITQNYFLILITKDLHSLTAIRASHNAARIVGLVRLKGFKQSKLDLQVAADTQFYFDNVQLDTLNAKVGGDDYAGKAELTLPFNSTINEASFNIGINGSVNLQGAKILKTKSTMVNDAGNKN